MQSGNGQFDEKLVADVVSEVLSRLGSGSAQTPRPSAANTVGCPSTPSSSPSPTSGSYVSTGSAVSVGGVDGVFQDVDAATAAAYKAQRLLYDGGMAVREKAVQAIRDVLIRDAEELGRMEYEETKLGRLDHKIEKNQNVATVPGVEMIKADVFSGDNGLTVTARAPFGVIGIVTPVTHSVPTLACNAIMILAAGNSLVCNAHPSGTKCAVEATRRFNREIRGRTGIDNLVCIIEKPTLESANQIFTHPDIRMLVATGGSAVVHAALSSGKRAIGAGPGNPPVVVDETADIEKAAAGIITGAAYDNNLLCISEKEIFVVDAVADSLMEAMGRHGGYRLTTQQMNDLAAVALHQADDGHWVANKDYIGKDPYVIAQGIGLTVPRDTQALYGETAETNPFVPCEQMMPVLPVVRVPNVDVAIDKAIYFEHGFKHTSLMWSNDVRNLTRMTRECEATIFVKNGPCTAGLGGGGEGYPTFTNASPTGDGCTNPLSFTRMRRCALADGLRIM